MVREPGIRQEFAQPIGGMRRQTLQDILEIVGRINLMALARHICLEGFDGFVTSTAAPIAPGWSDHVTGWELHPLKTNTSPQRTLAASPFPSPTSA
jgi:hypothetical protein